jgi:hypothetical protein
MAEAIDFVPGDVSPPGPDLVSRRASLRSASQQGKTDILHLVQVKDTLKSYHQAKHTGQQTSLQRTVFIGKAISGDVEPGEHLGPQQEGSGILSAGKKNSSGTDGTKAPVVGSSSDSMTAKAFSSSVAGGEASARE